jgi:hypothetical protein
MPAATSLSGLAIQGIKMSSLVLRFPRSRLLGVPPRDPQLAVSTEHLWLLKTSRTMEVLVKQQQQVGVLGSDPTQSL